ncbi:MAG: hypothetical protein ABDI19_01360 [Armatimonadota bacterium]
MTLASGRADAVFNRFVIEYERPGTLTARLEDRATKNAVEQLKRYISDLARQSRQDIHRVGGVAFDGKYIVFARYVDGEFTVESPLSVCPESLERMLTWLAALASGIALMPCLSAGRCALGRIRKPPLRNPSSLAGTPTLLPSGRANAVRSWARRRRY